MIVYHPGKWSVSFAFSLTGSVFPKALAWSVPAGILATTAHFLLRLQGGFDQRHTNAWTTVMGGFQFILGFLIVFRSQQAYSRWWEGGTLLQQLRGEWFNAFSSLLAFCNTVPEKTDEVAKFQHRLVRLLSLLFASALEQVTTMQCPDFELLDLDGFDLESLKFMRESHDRCEVVLQWIQRLIVEADNDEILDIPPPILSRVYNQLGNGIVNLNNARKITEFPIPFPLAQMVTTMLIIHWCIIVALAAIYIEQPYWAGILTFIVVSAFWGINYIACELEMPFGDDPNDLPLQAMQKDLNCSLVMLMQPLAQIVPSYTLEVAAHSLTRQNSSLDEYLDSYGSEGQGPKRDQSCADGDFSERPIHVQSMSQMRASTSKLRHRAHGRIAVLHHADRIERWDERKTKKPPPSPPSLPRQAPAGQSTFRPAPLPLPEPKANICQQPPTEPKDFALDSPARAIDSPNIQKPTDAFLRERSLLEAFDTGKLDSALDVAMAKIQKPAPASNTEDSSNTTFLVKNQDLPPREDPNHENQKHSLDASSVKIVRLAGSGRSQAML